MPAPLFDRLAPLRNVVEMTAHISDTVRHFPPCQQADVAEELIDRAERRGAITADIAGNLRETFELDAVTLARRA